jgi:hypothetical protein
VTYRVYENPSGEGIWSLQTRSAHSGTDHDRYTYAIKSTRIAPRRVRVGTSEENNGVEIYDDHVPVLESDFMPPVKRSADLFLVLS